MNRWINNELKRLHGWRDSSNDKGRTHRRTFLMEVLERPFSIDHLNPNNATCIICQYSLYPIEGEPWPTEDPVKLPCGHFIGQSCAKQWFSSLVKGQHKFTKLKTPKSSRMTIVRAGLHLLRPSVSRSSSIEPSGLMK
jgi:hypothetical protein